MRKIANVPEMNLNAVGSFQSAFSMIGYGELQNIYFNSFQIIFEMYLVMAL